WLGDHRGRRLGVFGELQPGARARSAERRPDDVVVSSLQHFTRHPPGGWSMKRSSLVVLVAILGISSAAAAQAVPPYLTDQGRLSDKNGSLVSGVVTLKYSLYAAATGGAALWSETQSVTFQNGSYAVKLGVVTALPASVFSGRDLWLGLTVGADA